MKNALQAIYYICGIGCLLVFMHTFVDSEFLNARADISAGFTRGLLRSVFGYLHSAFGPWGGRVALLSIAAIFFWFGAKEKRN